MKNRKGFTLIELLAVIVILGILLLVAIPSVTTYINNSRKDSYVYTAKEYIKGATNLVNTGELDMFDPDTTYYIPNTCIHLETGGDSPYGKFDPAYIIVTYDNNSYNYYWVSRDTASIGVKKVTLGDDLNIKSIVAGINSGDIKPTIGVGTRSQIKVLKEEDCKTLEVGTVEDKVSEGGNGKNCPNGKTNILCKRATTLHTEVCNATISPWYAPDKGCLAHYSKGATVTYGQIGTTGTLTPGDAFDCDVNGDGVYDAATERFYYVSPYFDTEASTGSHHGPNAYNNVFDSNYATLIYYNTYLPGVGPTYGLEGGSTYSKNGTVEYGPNVAVNMLPSTGEWCNVELKTTNRKLWAEYWTWHNNQALWDSATQSYRDLVSSFSYAGKAARLITAQELMRACEMPTTDNYERGELDKCKYILENTQYAHEWNTDLDYPDVLLGYWIETSNVYSWEAQYAVSGDARMFAYYYAQAYALGTRPTIDVPLSRMEY